MKNLQRLDTLGVMMKIKKKMATFAITVAAVAMSVLATPQAASASSSADMNLVCQQNWGTDAWRAKLVNPSQGVYGWKCWNGVYPEQYFLGPFFDADVNYYCANVFGTNAYFTNQSDANSWRCY